MRHPCPYHLSEECGAKHALENIKASMDSWEMATEIRLGAKFDHDWMALKEDNKRLNIDLEKVLRSWSTLCDEAIKKNVEIKRLREALKRIDASGTMSPMDAHETLLLVLNEARETLKGK